MQSLGRNLPLRRDPAPSRWSYRMQRLWLTPLFRMLFRVGVPVVLLAGSAGLVLHDQGRRDALSRGFADLRGQFEARPEFRVAMLAIEGASPDLSDAVRAKLAVKLPQSSFDIDLEAARARIQELDAIARADLATLHRELVADERGVQEAAETERSALRALDQALKGIDVDYGPRTAAWVALQMEYIGN